MNPQPITASSIPIKSCFKPLYFKMTETLGTALGIIGLVGLFSVAIDAGEVVSSYKDCDLDLRGTLARYEAYRILLRQWYSDCLVFSAPLPSQTMQVLSDTYDLLLSTENILAAVWEPGTRGLTTVVPTLDRSIRPPTPIFPTRPMGKLYKLMWAFGGKSALKKRVQCFIEHVNLLRNLAIPWPAGYSVAMTGLAVLWKDEYIQFKDTAGKISYIHVDLCQTAAHLVLCLMSILAKSDSEVKTKLRTGEFWLELEDEIEYVSKWPIQGSKAVVLADGWKDIVRPGRKFKLGLSTVINPLPAAEVEVLRYTWTYVTPYLKHILSLPS